MYFAQRYGQCPSRLASSVAVPSPGVLIDYLFCCFLGIGTRWVGTVPYVPGNLLEQRELKTVLSAGLDPAAVAVVSSGQLSSVDSRHVTRQ